MMIAAGVEHAKMQIADAQATDALQMRLDHGKRDPAARHDGPRLLRRWGLHVLLGPLAAQLIGRFSGAAKEET